MKELRWALPAVKECRRCHAGPQRKLDKVEVEVIREALDLDDSGGPSMF